MIEYFIVEQILVRGFHHQTAQLFSLDLFLQLNAFPNSSKFMNIPLTLFFKLIHIPLIDKSIIINHSRYLYLNSAGAWLSVKI